VGQTKAESLIALSSRRSWGNNNNSQEKAVAKGSARSYDCTTYRGADFFATVIARAVVTVREEKVLETQQHE
jgi:hypothetical protein